MERKAGNVEIGIWNHLDVVPEGKEWIYSPYTCTEKDGFLIGRGIQDNKGPAVAVLYAMKYCSEKEILNNIKVRQILGCQEESGMTDVEYYLKYKKAPEYSFVADCGFPVCCGEKGHGNCHCADEAELFENLKNAVKIYVFALKKLDKRIKEIR